MRGTTPQDGSDLLDVSVGLDDQNRADPDQHHGSTQHSERDQTMGLHIHPEQGKCAHAIQEHTDQSDPNPTLRLADEPLYVFLSSQHV
jgi:hypothetical protein